LSWTPWWFDTIGLFITENDGGGIPVPHFNSKVPVFTIMPLVVFMDPVTEILPFLGILIDKVRRAASQNALELAMNLEMLSGTLHIPNSHWLTLQLVGRQ
jgi:hypothetical protein